MLNLHYTTSCEAVANRLGGRLELADVRFRLRPSEEADGCDPIEVSLRLGDVAPT